MLLHKYSTIVQYIPIILSTIILVIVQQYKTVHPFWDKQPVMRMPPFTIRGTIGNNPKFHIKLKDRQQLRINTYPYQPIKEFLQNNFSNDYNIDHHYFHYIFHQKDAHNITLLEKTKIIGFIHSSPVLLNIDNKPVSFRYVDYLCIDRHYRNNYMATILIAAIIQKAGNKKQHFIFKKEFYSLPYSPILKSFYYIKDLRKLQPDKVDTVTKLTPFNFYKYYEYTNKLLKRYRVHKTYTKHEFFELFLNKKIVDFYIIDNESGFKTIIIGKKNLYKLNNVIFNCFEIDIIIGELRYVTDVDYSMTRYLKSKGFNYICIPYIGGNIKYITDNNYKQNSKVYFYTYNYNLPGVEATDFSFNIN